MPSIERIARISEEVRRDIDKIIREHVRDPRLSGTFSIVRADVTRDLRYCKVRVSVLEEDKKEPVLEALRSASGFIRRELSHALNLRYTPELLFEPDINIEYAARISQILKEAEGDAHAGGELS
jgi:ribosome-binding factor A